MTEQTPSTYKPTIRYTGGTTYAVQSRTRPERTHHADVYHLTCDCEAGQHGKRCWALALAISFDAWRRQEGKKARQAERVQAAHGSSAAPVQPAAPQPAAPQPAATAQQQQPARGTGDLPPLSRWFE